MKNILTTDYAPALQQFARAVAVLIAVTIVAAEMTYHAGRMTGTAIHQLNDTMAGIISGRTDWRPILIAAVAWAHSALAAPQSAPVATVSPILQRQASAATNPPAPAIGLQRPSLGALPVKQLRLMAREAGHKALARSGRRADLLAALGKAL